MIRVQRSPQIEKPGDEPGFLFVAAKTNRIMRFILLA